MYSVLLASLPMVCVRYVCYFPIDFNHGEIFKYANDTKCARKEAKRFSGCKASKFINLPSHEISYLVMLNEVMFLSFIHVKAGEGYPDDKPTIKEFIGADSVAII